MNQPHKSLRVTLSLRLPTPLRDDLVLLAALRGIRLNAYINEQLQRHVTEALKDEATRAAFKSIKDLRPKGFIEFKV